MSFPVESLLRDPDKPEKFRVEDLLRESQVEEQEDESTIPLIQQSSQSLFGVDPQSVPTVPPPVINAFERPAQLRTIDQIRSDFRQSALYQADLVQIPSGNIPAKAEALRQEARQSEIPLAEKSLFELALDIPSNAMKELKEFPRGIGLILGGAARDVAQFTGNVLSNLGNLNRFSAWIPNEQTGEFEEVVLPYRSIRDLPSDLVDRLVRLGARFGPEPDEGSAFDELLNAEARRAGFPDPDDLPEDATTFGIPFVDRDFSPRIFAEETSRFPIARLLDLAIIGRLPSIGARAAAATTRTSAAAASIGNASRIERGLARAGLKLDEFADAADAVMSINAARNLVRKGAELTPAGRQFFANHDARIVTREMIRESRETSFVRRRNSEIEISRALKDLTPDELRDLPAVLEGRLEFLPEAMSPQMQHALEVVRKNIYDVQNEMVNLGVFQAETVNARAFAPLVLVSTGKRIPPRSWDTNRVIRENAKIADDKSGMPRFMTPDEWASELQATRSRWEAFREDVTLLPETAEIQPTYFPRFKPEPTLREVLRNFFPSPISRMAKQPFQRPFTGSSFLRNADISDVRLSLLEHNVRSRRLLDNVKTIQALKTASFTKPLRVGDDLLPGHVAFNPDGAFQFYRGQVDLGEDVARSLENMGDLESALADAVAAALPVEFNAVAKRQSIFQVPRGVAKELEQTFRPTSPMTRIFWDSPTEAWKAGVLAFSPRWHLNNIVGGMILGTTAGVPPQRLVKPLSALERSALPERMQAQTLAFAEGFQPTLLPPATTEAGRLGRAIAQTKPIQLPMNFLRNVRDKSFGFNSNVDQHFRGRVYLEQARKMARNQLVKETGKGIISSRDILLRAGEISKDPVAAANLIKKTDRVFFNFNRLTPLERKYVRRVIPFWSWYREIARVTLSMPETMPVRAQGLRNLSRLGQQVSDSEIREHLGIPKRFLPEYLRDQTFIGLDNEGTVTFLSPRGANVFYGSTLFPLGETQGRIHPALQILIQEATGGRTIGKWGNYVPFRFKEAGKRFALDEQSGGLIQKTGGRGLGKRLARTIPLTGLLEDLAQFATEGKISQRFEDVTPLANLIPAATGRTITPTFVPDRSEDLVPRRERDLSQSVGAFFGASVQRYRLREIMENEVKARSGDLGTIFTRKYVSDPEFRKLFDRVLREVAGEPFEGLRTIDVKPES
jgi:hypothetical protein